jgi:hypothetical protein
MAFVVRFSMVLWMLTAQLIYGQQPVFITGMGGYAYFRMPALVRVGNGGLLAFSEGLRSGAGGIGAGAIVMRATCGRRCGLSLPMTLRF